MRMGTMKKTRMTQKRSSSAAWRPLIIRLPSSSAILMGRILSGETKKMRKARRFRMT